MRQIRASASEDESISKLGVIVGKEERNSHAHSLDHRFLRDRTMDLNDISPGPKMIKVRSLATEIVRQVLIVDCKLVRRSSSLLEDESTNP